MGLVKLELRCPKNSVVVASADPEPRWTWDDLLSELESLELLLGAAPSARPLPLKQSDCPDLPGGKEMSGSGNRPFAICISDDDVDEDSDDDDAGCDQSLMAGTRFSCNDLDSSDSEGSDDELYVKATQFNLMDKRTIDEGILFEFEFEHHLKVKEQVRHKLSALELYQQNESERSSAAMVQLEKYTEERREMDRRLDMQYRRMIAEVMNTHLSAVQRDHKQRSQIEEQRIRYDAALEEAQNKEKALQEELRRENVKAEEEAKLREAKKAEEAKKAAVEAARKASIEAAEKEAARIRESAATEVASKEATEQKMAASTETLRVMKEENLLQLERNMQVAGISVMAADAALKVEANRLKIYDEVAEKYNVVAQDFSRYGRKIHILVGQISGTHENIKAKANALLNIINNPECPRSISILIFAKKVVSLCDNPTRSFDNVAFACAHIILLLSSQVPAVMDFVLAEFHKACIYTVPKYMQPSHLASDMKDYRKMLGYREEDGKLESLESYLNRVRSYMKLYAALLQTEIEGIRNPHGLKEGWAWLARFLNALPPNRPTAVALEAFLKIAGFALYRRYGHQFRKVMNVVSRRFLPALKERDSSAGEAARLEKYIELKLYEVEPEGRRLRESLLSNEYRG